MSAPKIVKTVSHREKGLGHVAYVQRRSNAKMARYGGRRFAAWARRLVDGVPTGSPERFETYDYEAMAVSHATYAASQMTPTLAEGFSGRLP